MKKDWFSLVLTGNLLNISLPLRNGYVMKRLIFIFSLMFLLVSCKKTSYEVLPEVEVEPVLFSDNLIMTPPLQMKDLKSHLVFVTPGMEQSLVFFDKKRQKTQAWGKIGNGPDDFTSAALVEYKDGKVKLFDSNLRKCVEYRLQLTDSVQLHRLHEYRYQSDSITLLNLHVMDNGMMVGFAGIGCAQMFVLLDSKMQQVKTFGTVPLNGLPEKNNLQLYGWFTSYKNKLFFASQSMGYLVCFNIEDNQVTKEWEQFLTEPLYDLESRKWKKENKYGFFDVVANDKYVFAAFSGKSVTDSEKLIPQNVLVFTHEGKLVKNVRYRNAAIGKMALSDDSKIYTIGGDELMCCDLQNWGLNE